MAPLGMETELQGVQSHGRARCIAPPCFQRQQQGSSGQKQDTSVSFPCLRGPKSTPQIFAAGLFVEQRKGDAL